MGNNKSKGKNTIIVAVEEYSFNYLLENKEYNYPISQNKEILEYIAFYRVAPISAITHYGKVKEKIENAEVEGQYRVMTFGDKAQESAIKIKLEEIEKLDHPVKADGRGIQGFCYLDLEVIKDSKKISTLFKNIK